MPLFNPLRWIKLLAVTLFCILVDGIAIAQNLVTYAGNSGRETFNDVYRLPNGRILVAGRADNLSWITAPITTLNITPAPGQTVNSAEPSTRAFILLLNTQSTAIVRAFVFPAGTVHDVSRIRTTDNPTIRTDDSTFAVYISGRRTTSDPAQDGYYIARLNGNFITGAGGTSLPTGTSWYYSVGCPFDGRTSAYKEIQPWDVGNDGQVVFGRGKAYTWDWASIEKLDAQGRRTVVENWPAHWSATSELPAYRKASSFGGAAVFSAIVLKAGRQGSLRSSITGDPFWNGYNWNQTTDEIGNPRVGKFPDDWYFSGPFNGSNGGPNQGGRGRLTNPQTNTYGDSVRTYKTNSNSGGQMHPTQRLGGIAIDRRDNHVYFGYSTQTSFFTSVPFNGKNWVPDFEPAVVAMTADGTMKWFARTYDQRGISPPDQYIDGVEVDYAGNTLVALGRQHGSNSIAMWRGNQTPGASFQNQYTGVNSVATGHYSWIGKYDLIRTSPNPWPVSPVIKYSTYMMEYRDPAAGLGAPSSDPKLDGWPSPNSGFPDLNTTRFPAVGRVAVTPGGAVCVIGAGQRTITTADAFQKMPKQSSGSRAAWNQFVRIYLPDLSGLVYSSLLTGRWDTLSGAGGANTEIEGIFPYNGGIYAVGRHTVNQSTGAPNGLPIPTAAIPAWGNSTPQNESAIFARLRIDQNYPISVQLNTNVFCAATGNNVFQIRFTPPPDFLTQFNPGNIFRVELSAPNGKFGGQGGFTRLLGTLSSTSNAPQTITATFPNTLTPGSSYGLRVRALNPLIPGPGVDTVPGYWYNVTIVTAIPATPGPILGDVLICGNTQPTTTYTVRKAANAINYEWEITPTVANFQDPCVLPSCAGVIGGTDTSAVVSWNPNFSGTATIRVRAVNPCGTSTGWSTLSGITVAPCISASFQGSICTGLNSDVQIPFVVPAGVTISGVNSFTAQLSDASGSFALPVNIGSVTNIPGGPGPRNGVINGINIPLGTAPGSTYRIRVVGTGTTPLVQGFPTGNITVRTPPAKPTLPVGLLNYCFNNIRTGNLPVSTFRSLGGVAEIVSNNHGLISGERVMLIFSNPALTAYNGVWTVNVSGNNNFTLVGSSYSGPNVGNTPGEIVWNTFFTNPMTGVSYFEWVLSNPALGSFVTNNDPVTVINFANVAGSGWLKVRAVNECGSGSWSDSIQINVESCIRVNLEPGSTWCPGSLMNTTTPGGSLRLQLSKSPNTIYFSSSNYRVELSDATGSFLNPSFSSNIFRFNNENLNATITGVANGPGKIIITAPNHGLNSGANIRMSGFHNGYSYLNNFRDSITVIDQNTFRLERSALCPSNCNQTQLAYVSGHDLLSPLNIAIPLPATMTPSPFYQIRVSCIQNCANNSSSINAPFNFNVGTTPTLSAPTGLATGVCGTTQTYSIPAVPGAVSYTWSVAPAAAGTITGTGNSVSIAWSGTYTGVNASITVKVLTSCGTTVSTPLTVTTNCNPPTQPPLPGVVIGSYRTRQSGNWRTAATWERFDGSNWVAATQYPGDDGSPNDDPAAQYIYIGGYGMGSPPAASNHTLTLDANLSADQIVVRREGGNAGTLVVSNASLTVLNGTDAVDAQVAGTIRVDQGGSINSIGVLGILEQGIYRHNYTTSVGNIANATWFVGSTCLLEGWNNLPANPSPPGGLNQLFHNFTINATNLNQNLNFQGQLRNVLGTFFMQGLGNGSLELILTETNTDIYFRSMVINSGRLILNAGNNAANSNTLTTTNLTLGSNGNLLGSNSGANGNLIVNGEFAISKGEVVLTTGSGTTPTWTIRDDLNIFGDAIIAGNRGGSNNAPVINIGRNLTINNNNARVSGGFSGVSNTVINVGRSVQLQNGLIAGNTGTQGGQLTMNIKGSYVQTGGRVDSSWAAITFNVDSNFTVAAGYIGSRTRALQTIAFTGSGTQNLDITGSGSFIGDRISLTINKTSGALSVNNNINALHINWIKGDLNLGTIVINGLGFLNLLGSGTLGSINATGAGELRTRWLNATSGILNNANDKLLINGGSGGAIQARNTQSWVSDYLRFRLNAKQIANNNFSINGNWNGPSTVTLNNHGLQDGDMVTITGITNNGGAFNGTYTITRTGNNTFTLNNTTFPGNWSSSNTGTITRTDNFEAALGSSTAFQGISFNKLQNDNADKVFRLHFKSTGANENNGSLIQQVGQVPGILGRNWMVQRVSGTGVIEALESVALFVPNAGINNRIGQSNSNNGVSGYESRGGVLASGGRIVSTKTIQIATFDFMGTWFAIGNAVQLTVPPGGFNIPGNYPNLTAVAAEYNDVTFSGPVTFNFGVGYNGREDGPTPERFPIVFNRKQNHPVTIRATAANRETSNSNLATGANSALIVFDGVSNITFDGAHNGGNWRFVQYGIGDSANVFRLVNGATNINIRNNDIQASATQNSYTGAILIGRSSAPIGNSNNTIANNTIRNNQANRKPLFIKRIIQTERPGYIDGALIINASQTTPVVCTTSVNHLFSNGQRVRIRNLDPSGASYAIAGVTGNGVNPIRITSANPHGLTTGSRVVVGAVPGIGSSVNVQGNTAANGTWTITVIDNNTFSLNGSTANGNFIPPAPGQPSPTWRCLDPIILNGDYYLGNITDTTFTLYLNSSLTIGYGPKGRFSQGRGDMSGSYGTVVPIISNVSNTTPVVITTSANHFLQTGNTVRLSDSLGVGTTRTWIITRINATQFSLNTSTAADFPAGRWQFEDVPLVVVTSVSHPLATGNLIDINGVEFPPNANGNFVTTVINDTTFSLNGTSYYQTPYYGPARMRNLITTAEMNIGYLNNTTPVKTGTGTSDGWLSNHWVEITGETNGILTPGTYRMWIGRDNSREIIIRHTRKINPPYRGNPVATFDQGISRGIVANNPGTALNVNNVIENNNFENIIKEGLGVTSAGNGSRWRINNNHYYLRGVPGPRSGGGRDFIAFNFSPGIKSNNNEIIGNNVGGTAPFCGGAPLSFGLSSGQYTQVMLTAFLVDVGDQQPTIIRRNRVSNINGVGPGDRVRQNANQSSGSLHINITPNAGIVGGIDHRGGLAIIGGDSYDEANWHGDTLARDDFSIDMYGESGQTFAIRTNTSSNTVISKNIIGNVKSRARAYSGNGSFSCIIGEGTGSPQVSKNLMRNIVGVPTNAIIMRATGQQILLDSNNMADFVVSGNGLYGIFVDANGSGGTIKGNRFYRSQCLPFNGVGNNMSALEITGAPGGAGWTVVNNQFSFDFRRWRGRFDPSFAGIRHNTSGGVPVRYFFNTVYMSGPLGDPGWSTSCFRKDGNGSLIFRNNMLVNESGGGSGAHYAINIDNTTNWNGNNVTNNLYYAYGGNSFLARFNTTQITDINVWEGFAGGTNNMESPVFWKYEQPDYLGRLQLSGENCPIKDKGINVGIFDDYDSLLVRDRVTPDIGSHEFSNELPIGAFWVGGVNNDWHLEANWCDQKVPQAFEDVTISNLPRRRNMPIVSTDNAVCRNLRILDNPGSMLTIWGDRANLIVYGDSGRMQWKHSNFANITGAMTFGSDSLQSIPAPPTDLGYNRRNLVLNPIAVTTVSITAAGATITTAGNHNLNYGEFVRISRIDGVPSLNGSFKIFRTPSANTIEIRGSFSGTYTGNRGMVTPLAVLPIRAMIVGANSITVQVSRNHGLSNGQNVSLVGVKGIDAANGAFAISNVNNDRFDIPVKTFSTFANDTNAFMIPSLTGYYDLRLTGSNIKVAEGAIEAASVMATGATFITNRNSLELRDSLVARNGGRIIIEDPTTTTVGSHFTRNGVGNGAINALSNSLFGLMSADSGRIDFAGTDLVVCDTIRVRRSGVININAGRIFSKNVHAFRGQLNQNNAEVTATQKIIASANGRYSISGNGFAASRDSIWVKRNGLIQTEAGSTADLLALNTSAMLGGNILLSGSGNLYTGGLFFRAGLITTGGQNRVILPSSNNINLNTIGEGNDSSFVNGRLAHQHGRLLASLPLTNIQATANGPFTLRTGSNHNFATGDVVLVQGLTAAGGNRANGAYIIDVLDNTNFRLRGSVAQGAINAASPGGTVTRLQSRFYPIGKQTEYRPMNVHLDQGTVGETALSLPLVSFSNNNGVAILTTAGNHNFRNRQPVTLVNSGLSNVNPVYYIRVESPNSFRLFNDFLLSANPGISGTLSAGATVIGHAEYVAEAFLTKPDSLIMPPATPSWFGNWTDQVIGVHQSRFTRFTQISHLSTPFRINGGAVRLSYRQSEINPSFHNNRYLTIVKDSLWPTPPHNRWLNRVGNSVDSIAPLKTIHSVKPFTTPGVFTLGFLNILPCNHEANAGRDTTFCHNVLDSLGTRGLPGFTYRWRRIDPWQGGSFLSDTTRARLGVRAINTTNQAYKVRFELTMARSVDCQKKDTVEITVLPGLIKPIIFPPGPLTFCPNPVNTVFSTVGGYDKYYWQIIPAWAGEIIGDSNQVEVDWNDGLVGVVKVVVRLENKCGLTPLSDTVRVDIGGGAPKPATPTTASTTLCTNPPDFMVNVSPVQGATNYEWRVFPSAAAVISGNTNSINVNPDNTFNGVLRFIVRVTTDCGTSIFSDTLRVTIAPGSPAPQKPFTANPNVCFGTQSSLVNTVKIAGANSYQWVVNPSVAATSIAGDTHVVTINWNQVFTGTVWVKVRVNGSCGVSPSSDSLQFTILPQKIETVDVTACNSYTWNGQTYTQSGAYTFTTQTAQGCDSTITLNLTIAPTVTAGVDVTACNSYTWNGQTYTQSGTYTFTTQTAQGCDSTITLNLTIAPTVTASVDVTACNSYTWNGQTYTQSGIYTFTTQTAQGCDSTITLNLTIAPSINTSMDITACNSYTWNGQIYTQSGTYTFTTQTAQGCDSTITLNLTIAPSINTSMDITACNSYIWNGQTYTQSGTYTFTTQTAQGCDSTITLNLTIAPTVTASVDVTACNSYTWNGQTYTQSGAYTFTTQTAQGCDSTITLNLTIAPSITASVDVTACNSYTWNGQTYTQSGIYTYTTQTAQGCDSTITLNLTISPSINTSVDVTACNSYTWNGQTYTQSGAYTFTTQTAQGCDSTITLNLTIAPSITASVDVTACNSYTWNGQTYTQSGAYTFTTQTAQGCDSTITLNLTIAPTVTASVDVTTCNSYTWNGQTYTQSGTYTFTTQTAQGCDSTITLNLTIAPSITASVDVTTCNSYTWNGQTYTQSGAYTFTTQTAQGCDSTITLNLTIAPAVTASMDVTACNSYTWNGQTYTQSGAYTFSTQTAQGCDSTITLNLTISPSLTANVDVTACNSYTWNGQTYTQSGAYTFTTQTAQGCDSTITLNLTIAPSINTSMDVTACNSYTWNGQTYTQSGAYTFTTQTAQGCDSTITLNLTITPAVTGSVDVTACNSYTWNGQTYTQSGTYTFTTQTAQGCDSTITLNLTIAPSINTSMDVTACNSYTWNGQTYTQSGAYTFTTQTAQGCDSTITLNLTIAPTVTASVDVTTCNSYTWNGQTYTQSGTYTFTTQTAQGCDSTITLNLTIAPSITASVDVTACNSYTWNGQTYTQSGAYTFTTQTAQGCDSTITLNLTIAPSINTSMDITACNSYTWNGQTYTQSGTYTFTTQTAQGCDSTITLNLTIAPSINTSMDITACNSYTWNGQIYTQSGTYTFTTQTAQGCDSTITLNLTIAPSINTSMDITACNSYTWNGQTYTQSGAYTFTTQTAQGCDSTITLNLTISPSINTSVDVTACNSYTWNGQTYTQSGAYTFTTQTAQGCDSTITLNLTIAPSINASVDVTTCNSYTWNGQTYTQSGAYTFTTQTAQGCDSTITLNLTIAPSVTASVDVTACNSYTWNGQTYTQSGAYTFTTQTAQGCDSTITLNLTIAPSINASVDVTTCNSYTWNGQTYTQSGTYTFTTQTAQGCDSTITLNLTIAPSINTSVDVTTCNSYTWNGQTYTQSGAYTFTTQTAQGCDSTITLNLTIAPGINTSVDVTTCNSYTWNGQTYTQSGAYTFTTQTAQGCDSTITLNLIVTPLQPATILGLDTNYCQQNQVITLMAEPTGGVFKVNGNVTSSISLNTPGVFVVRYLPQGCFDSTQLQVRVQPRITPQFVNSDTLYCVSNQAYTLSASPSGGTFIGLFVSGNQFTTPQAGNFTIRYFVGGCSDTASYTFNVSNAPQVVIAAPTDRLCASNTVFPLTLLPSGGTLLINGLPEDNFIPSQPGNYQLIYRYSVLGCIGSDTLNVSVDTRPQIVFNPLPTPLCSIDTIITLTGFPVNGRFNGPGISGLNRFNPRSAGAGTHTLYHIATNGVCTDSVGRTITVLQAPVVNAGGNDTLCQGSELVQLTGQTPANGFWSGPGVSTDGFFNPDRSGTFILVYRVPDDAGCKGRDLKTIVVKPGIRISWARPDTVLCEGQVVRLNPLIANPTSIRWQDGSNVPVYLADRVGSYYVEVKDKHCTYLSDTFRVREVQAVPEFSIGRDTAVCFTKPFRIKAPSGFRRYEWRDMEEDTIISRDTTIALRGPSTIKLTVFPNRGNCPTSREIDVEELNCEELFVPEAFSPNADGVNDVWRVWGQNVNFISIKVYNEWGECVFATFSRDQPWDGRYKGALCPAGGYKYFIEYEGATPRGRNFKGKTSGTVFLIK